MKSILQIDNRCLFCGAVGDLETHHVFFGNPGRRISEKNGFKVRLCHRCHRTGKNSPHQNREVDLELKRFCQKRYEELGHSRSEFVALVGRNYLD